MRLSQLNPTKPQTRGSWRSCTNGILPGPPGIIPHFCPKWRKIKRCTFGVEFKILFVCNQKVSLFLGLSKNVCDSDLTYRFNDPLNHVSSPQHPIDMHNSCSSLANDHLQSRSKQVKVSMRVPAMMQSLRFCNDMCCNNSPGSMQIVICNHDHASPTVSLSNDTATTATSISWPSK